MKWIVQWIIEGETEIEAKTRDDAQIAFEAMNQTAIATDGCLSADEPRTPEEIEEGRYWEDHLADAPLLGDGS